MSDMHPEFQKRADEITEEASPIIGTQRARLGSERFMRFTQAHAELQAMALFLVMSVLTTPQVGFSDEALDALRQDAKDLRMAAGKLARLCEELADHWQAQRQEHESLKQRKDFLENT